MITPSELYWIFILDNIRAFCGIYCVGGLIAFIGVFAFWLWAEDKPLRLLTASILTLLSVTLYILAAAGSVFIPTTQQMAMIKVLPAIVNNEKVQAEAGELYNLAKEGLKQLVGKAGAK